MESRWKSIDTLIDYVEANNHYKSINDMSKEDQDQYHNAIDELAKFSRQLRRAEQTKAYLEEKDNDGYTGNDLAGSLISVAIHLTNEIDEAYLKTLPTETQSLFFSVVDQFGNMIEIVEPEDGTENG